MQFAPMSLNLSEALMHYRYGHRSLNDSIPAESMGAHLREILFVVTRFAGIAKKLIKAA
jgi:hypothetical protein